MFLTLKQVDERSLLVFFPPFIVALLGVLFCYKGNKSEANV